jgi:hypothetical protein
MSIVVGILKFALPFVVGAITHAVHRARAKERELIDKQVHNERLKSVLLHFDEVVAAVVKDLSQTVVEGLKLAGDGKLNHDARSALRSQAIAKVRDYMGAHGLGELAELLQLAEGALLAFIESKIEAKVHDVKRPTMPAVNTGIRLPPPILA